MARRHPRPPSTPTPAEPPPQTTAEPRAEPAHRSGRVTWLLVAAILTAHYVLAALSLRQENPTIDEVNHLPAGISYWQAGTFKLYHHNPPLVKLVAALPVADAVMEPLFRSAAWRSESPPPASIGVPFMLLNARNYLEIFTLSRMLMPLFSVLGGLVVFGWSRRLWGDLGGLLSLALWCLCPNILAHARLITSDVPAAAIGMAATYAFWRYLHARSWRLALLAGALLGLAQLTKFSLLILYGIWPVLWLVREAAGFERAGAVRRLVRAIAQGAAMVATSILIIDLGYGFEGVGRPLGSFPFASRSFLTRPGRTPMRSDNQLIDLSWRHRVNRFRGTWMAGLPAPLPSHYLLGFDEQKIEADALPTSWFDPTVGDPDAVTGYPVYLDGVLRRTGWRSYYVKALLYKVPEGTLFLVGLSLVVLVGSRRSRTSWPDEFALLFPPIAVLGAMTFLTDINLGLRYVLAMFPYVFVFLGRLAPWAEGLVGASRKAARLAIVLPLGLTLAATLAIHPHYLAYFNLVSGGPDRMPPHLIDSNLDWGQDLVGLRRWIRDHRVEEPIGLAYFGQITPNLFAERGEGFPWFLPPTRHGTLRPMMRDTTTLDGPAPRLTPGLYAVSATLLQGLPWRVYDPSRRVWAGTWNTIEDEDPYGYFRRLTPIDRVGHSILIYRVTASQAARINETLTAPRR